MAPRQGAEIVTEKQSPGHYPIIQSGNSKNEVDLTLDECVMPKARVAAIYLSPLIVGRIGDLLEGRKVEVPAENHTKESSSTIS